MTYEPPPAKPPSAPKRSNTWKIVLVIVAVVLAICCVGAIAFGIWGFRTFQDTTGPAKDTVDTYFDDVEAGNYGSAYDRLCSSAQNRLTQQEFEQAYSFLPKITGHEITGVNVSNQNGKVTGTVTVKLTREQLGEIDQEIQVVKEGGKWKVCQPAV